MTIDMQRIDRVTAIPRSVNKAPASFRWDGARSSSTLQPCPGNGGNIGPPATPAL